MSPRHRNRLRALWLASLALLLLLAGALPGLTLLPERSYEVPLEKSSNPVLDLGWLISVMVGVYLLVFLFFIRELRWRMAYSVIALWLLAGLIVALVWLAGDEGIEMPLTLLAPPLATPTIAPPDSAPEPVLPAEAVVFTPPERWVRLAAFSGVILLCVTVLAGLAWWAHSRVRRPAPPPLAELATQAQMALEALYGGADVRDVVIRCYFEMARTLDERQGLRRIETTTPREFAAQLTRLGLPAEPVQTLTRLFEVARYGGYTADASANAAAAQQAQASLRAIVAACEALA